MIDEAAWGIVGGVFVIWMLGLVPTLIEAKHSVKKWYLLSGAIVFGPFFLRAWVHALLI